MTGKWYIVNMRQLVLVNHTNHIVCIVGTQIQTREKDERHNFSHVPATGKIKN